MPIVRSATPSGLISARRLGIKSANKTNVMVDSFFWNQQKKYNFRIPYPHIAHIPI